MEKKLKAKSDYKQIIRAFEEASKLSVSFVLLPVIFLVLGVILDKKLETVPLFIVSGVIVGFVSFVYKVKKTIQDLKKNN